MSRVSFLVVLVTLPLIVSNPNAHRSHVQVSNLRGNSFGLENYLFQTYEDSEIKEQVQSVKPKRVRPPVIVRKPIGETGQRIFGLENLNVPTYELNRLKPQTRINPELPKQRPVENEQNVVKVINVSDKEEKTGTIEQEKETISLPEELVTEKIRKRIMMRRRRKRPSSNIIQTDDNSEMSGNFGVKPLRIPVYSQVPKVVIRTKLSESYHKTIPTNPPIEETTEAELTTEEEKLSTKEPKTTEKPSSINLKTFLKQQTETLSLSELLQTQNLSLADLLRGNKDASAILKANQAISLTTQEVPIKIISLPKTHSKLEAETTEQTSPKKMEVIEVTSLRPNYNRFVPKVPRLKPADQITSKSENKPTTENTEDVKKPSMRPNFHNVGFDPQNRLNELRTKLKNFQKKTYPSESTTAAATPVREETIEPVSSSTERPLYKKNRVSYKSANNPDLSIIVPTKAKPEPETLKRPERLSGWTNRMPPIKRFGIKQEELLSPKPLKVPFVDEETIRTEEPEVQVKTTPAAVNDMQKQDTKDELIELLKTGHNADRLQKILESRNMTIQELLDNREKPPLQVNITELFSNHQKEEAVKSTEIPTLFDSLPNFELEPTNVRRSPVEYEEPFAEESAPTIARVEMIVNRVPKVYDIPVPQNGPNPDLNLKPDDLQADTSNTDNLALWKLSEKAIYYGSSYGYGDAVTVQQEPVTNTELTESEIILLETIRKHQDTNRKFKLDYTDFAKEEEGPQAEDIEMSYIPPAVKSAIIASGVVMGIALFVFIAIFAACGWKQRQIRLKGSSSILSDSLAKTEKRSSLSPVSFKDSSSYKKTMDFDDETSESETSNTSSYLWSTLKNTFTSRTSTLKSRMEREEKMREDKSTIRRNESRRKVESRSEDRSDDIFVIKKIDQDRNVINTSFNFKRSPSNSNLSHFNECVHGY